MHTRLKHFGFSLLATFAAFAGLASAQVYTSSGAITINDSGPANPYPSVINVTNGPTSIARLSVRINGLTHTFSPDIDVMLVAPGGQSVILMSDAGNSSNLTGVNLTFADGFPQLAIAQIASGTYACTNLPGSEQFAPPAPIASNTQTSLASLMGTNANGAWSLFVLDDADLDSGSIQSWSLEFNAAATVAQGSIDTAFTYQGRLENNGAPVNGPIDVRYQFWTDSISAAQGSTIGPPLIATGVQAGDGLFRLGVPLVDGAKREQAVYVE
ncbi:MAG: proprotein convertase P-domain-containing protein, partial [Phycisphaerae bacterium]